MQILLQYVIFSTKWGYFGIAGRENTLLRSLLPEKDFEAAESRLLLSLPKGQFVQNYQKDLQQRIARYFENNCCDSFRDFAVDISAFSSFEVSVLTTTRDITFGQTASYSKIAEKAGSPGAYRAVGNVLAKNPLPLIIPCHRIICSNGRPGGFSATGGIDMKNKLLSHEKTLIPCL